MIRPSRRLTAIAAGLGALAALSGGQVIAGDGEIIVLRQVSPRPAVRHPGSLDAQGPVRVRVDTSPDDKVESALGLGVHPGGTVGKELADGDYASVMTRNSASMGGNLGTAGVLTGESSGAQNGAISATRSLMTGSVAGGGGGGVAGRSVERAMGVLGDIMVRTSAAGRN